MRTPVFEPQGFAEPTIRHLAQQVGVHWSFASPLALSSSMVDVIPPIRLAGACRCAMGTRAFTHALRQVRWPRKFKPEMPPRYDGAVDPTAFLQAYEKAVLKAGGDDQLMAN